MPILEQWDEIDLSTPQSRRERMEILVCQKAQQSDDLAQVMMVLLYLRNQAMEFERNQLLIQEAREKSVFASLQRVIITAFAILGMIAFFAGALKSPHSSPISIQTPPTVKLNTQDL